MTVLSSAPALIGIKPTEPPRWPFHVDMDHPHSEGLAACWMPVGNQVFEVTGRNSPGAAEGATLPAIDDTGRHAIDTVTGTTDADIVTLGGYRLPSSTTSYSALHRTRNMNAYSSTNRYFAFGQTDLSSFSYDWGGLYIDGTDIRFWPISGSNVSAGYRPVSAGEELHWIGAYDSGVRTNQYINGETKGTSTSISGSPGTAYDLAVGPRWASVYSFRQHWFETAIYEDFFISEDLAADMYDRPYAKFVETGRKTFFLAPASAYDFSGSGTPQAATSTMSSAGAVAIKGSGTIASAVATMNSAGAVSITGAGATEAADAVMGGSTVLVSVKGTADMVAQLTSTSGTAEVSVKGLGTVVSAAATLIGFESAQTFWFAIRPVVRRLTRDIKRVVHTPLDRR